MAIKSAQAWLIHKQWSGDSSARVYFFTAEQGIIHCMYKGGRSPKKQAVLQPFTSLWISWVERYHYHYVQCVETESFSLPLSGMNLFSALYLNELVYYLIKPLVPEYALYTSYVLTLHRLAQAENRSSIEALLRRFEWALLGACGQQFSLVHEAGKPNLIEAHYYYRLIPGQGMVRSERGIPGSDVLAIAADDLTQPDYLRSAKILMRQAIEPLLDGQEIKARSILAALIKKEVSNQSLE